MSESGSHSFHELWTRLVGERKETQPYPLVQYISLPLHTGIPQPPEQTFRVELPVNSGVNRNPHTLTPIASSSNIRRRSHIPRRPLRAFTPETQGNSSSQFAAGRTSGSSTSDSLDLAYRTGASGLSLGAPRKTSITDSLDLARARGTPTRSIPDPFSDPGETSRATSTLSEATTLDDDQFDDFESSLTALIQSAKNLRSGGSYQSGPSKNDWRTPSTSFKIDSTTPTPEAQNYSSNQIHIAEISNHPKPVFGVPIAFSITYASAVSYLTDGKARPLETAYDNIPLVISKCGTFLQKNGLYTQAVFRTPGDPLRVQELVDAFSSAPYYGMLLPWDRYEVNDMATVFLLYFQKLPEPVISYADFDRFLEAYQKYQSSLTEGTSLAYSADTDVIESYTELISQMQQVNRSLLLYVLGILSLFASMSATNGMTSRDLASIFQPGLLKSSIQSRDRGVVQQSIRAIDVITFLIDSLGFFVFPQSFNVLTDIHAETSDAALVTEEASIARPAAPINITAYDKEVLARLHLVDVETRATVDSDLRTATSTPQPFPEDEKERDTTSVSSDNNLTLSERSRHLENYLPVIRNDIQDEILPSPLVKARPYSTLTARHDGLEVIQPLRPARSDSNIRISSESSYASVLQEDIGLQIPVEIAKRAESQMNNQPQIFASAESSSLRDKDIIEFPGNKSLLSIQSTDNEIKSGSEPAKLVPQMQNLDSIFQLHREQVFSEAEIMEVAQFLRRNLPSWSKIPRIYIVLRIIGCLDVCDAIVKSGFSDYELPFSTKGVPKQLSAEAYSKFLAAQGLVKTTTVDLECGAAGQHHHFDAGDPFPFDIREPLGAGGFGQVDKVVSLRTNREFARKRVTREAVSKSKGLAGLRGIIKEIELLKTLTHRHIVKFVGSYTDQEFLGLIMSPVAELDFSDYLSQAKPTQHSSIRSFFGCLTAGLVYLHRRRVRHKDITPRNILISQGSVLLTDFGLASEFTDAAGSTSIGQPEGLSPRYVAPEVIYMESRNTKSDIWSLGIVFLEMIVVLKNWNNKQMDEFMVNNGEGNVFVRANRSGFEELVVELQKDGSQADNIALEWVKSMLLKKHKRRPSAAELLKKIVHSGEGSAMSGRFCGFCCRDEDENDLLDGSD